ncbi:hypothetical protein VaNZ11_013308 [Volvox africanus]|uniref:Uncharacterized protein n=1 Tax=Volvox africanus TaxID=51714 RepID=A0ABQ5SFX2_9CHLO|nr:hypothetical protein VaNZ11_013308 [Volvox africanus]
MSSQRTLAPSSFSFASSWNGIEPSRKRQHVGRRGTAQHTLDARLIYMHLAALVYLSHGSSAQAAALAHKGNYAFPAPAATVSSDPWLHKPPACERLSRDQRLAIGVFNPEETRRAMAHRRHQVLCDRAWESENEQVSSLA